MNRLLVLFVTLAVAGFRTFAAPAVQVALELEAPQTLPGVPVGVTVRVTNSSDHSVYLPPYLTMTMRGAGGEQNVLHSTSSDLRAIALNDAQRQLGPGETRQFDYDVPVTVLGAAWLLDPQVSTPGEYTLLAHVTDAVDRESSVTYGSNEVRLAVRPFSDDDAAVWKWMAQRADGVWGEAQWMEHMDAFGAYVLHEHPRSNYVPYLILHAAGGATADAGAAIDAVIRDFPASLFRDQLKLYEARHELNAAAYYGRGERGAAAETHARALLADVAQHGRRRSLRDEARAQLARMPAQENVIHEP